jgi:hypothetical protein
MTNKNDSKYIINPPKGENLPNLVTLVEVVAFSGLAVYAIFKLCFPVQNE